MAEPKKIALNRIGKKAKLVTVRQANEEIIPVRNLRDKAIAGKLWGLTKLFFKIDFSMPVFRFFFLVFIISKLFIIFNTLWKQGPDFWKVIHNYCSDLSGVESSRARICEELEYVQRILAVQLKKCLFVGTCF